MKRGKGSVRGDLGGEGGAVWRVGDRERTGSGRYNVSRLRTRKGCGPLRENMGLNKATQLACLETFAFS